MNKKLIGSLLILMLGAMVMMGCNNGTTEPEEEIYDPPVEKTVAKEYWGSYYYDERDISLIISEKKIVHDDAEYQAWTEGRELYVYVGVPYPVPFRYGIFKNNTTFVRISGGGQVETEYKK